MIALQLEGRLGNQLFQYAFIYAESRRLNTSFYLDKSVENFLLPQYFGVKNDMFAALDHKVFAIKGYKNIFSFYSKRAFYNFVNRFFFGKKEITVTNDTLADDAFLDFKNNHLYKGYFQSESYFHEFRDEIRELYKINDSHISAFREVTGQTGGAQKKVVIHIRRSDYVGLDIELPLTYFKKAIESIGETDADYIFISDDPAFIEAEFADIPCKYVSTHSEIIDLQFLINADICILSNSSFSWWGAWLNQKPGKQVYAPRYWMGFKQQKEFPAGVSDHQNINWIEV